MNLLDVTVNSIFFFMKNSYSLWRMFVESGTVCFSPPSAWMPGLMKVVSHPIGVLSCLESLLCTFRVTEEAENDCVVIKQL